MRSSENWHVQVEARSRGRIENISPFPEHVTLLAGVHFKMHSHTINFLFKDPPPPPTHPVIALSTCKQKIHLVISPPLTSTEMNSIFYNVLKIKKASDFKNFMLIFSADISPPFI